MILLPEIKVKLLKELKHFTRDHIFFSDKTQDILKQQ